MNRCRGGFTLIEMLIVVAIIAVLAGVGYNYYGDILPEARENTARLNLKIVRDAISRYFKDNMAYPTSLEVLQGPYLQQPVVALLVTILAGNTIVRVEVPTDAAIADPLKGPNVYQLAPADRIWVDYNFISGGSGGKQIRNLKIIYNGTEMPW